MAPVAVTKKLALGEVSQRLAGLLKRLAARKQFLVMGTAAALTIAVVAATWNDNPTAIGTRNGKRVLYGSGTIEATEVGIASEVPGRIREVPVQEGQAVRVGDVVAVLDDSQLQQQVAQARSAVAGAEARLAQARALLEAERARVDGNIQAAMANLQKLESGFRSQEIEEARKAVDQARATFQSAEGQFRRAEKLHAEGGISDEQFEQVRSAYEVARAKLAQAEQHLSLVLSGYRQEDIAAARANYEVALAGRHQVETREKEVEAAEAALASAQAGLKLAEEQLAKAVIHTRTDGVVLRRNFDPGEVVSPGVPIVTILNPADAWLAIYVPETAIGHVKLGQKVDITVDSLPDKVFQGQVTEISTKAEFTPKNVQTKEERVDLVFRVKIGIENEGQLLKSGMPADAVVYLDAEG